MNASRLKWLRFLIAGPFAALALFLYGFYFVGLREWGIENSWLKYPWVLVFGTLAAIANVSWNFIGASFVFLKPPVFRDSEGNFSMYFTTRITKYRQENTDKDMADLYAKLVNQWLPGHFNE
jgi:hypothetical protein